MRACFQASFQRASPLPNPGPRLRLRAAELIGRVGSDWDEVTRLATNPAATAGLKTSFAAAQDSYFGREKPLRQQLIDKLTAGEAPGITIDAWLSHAMSSSESAGEVGTATLDDLVATAHADARAALRNLILSIWQMPSVNAPRRNKPSERSNRQTWRMPYAVVSSVSQGVI